MNAGAVIRGEARWCVKRGDCEGFAWPPGMLTSARIIADVPYGSGAYATDKGISDATIARWLGAKTLALFGWPEDLIALCVRLQRPVDEWVTWSPPNKWLPRCTTLRQAECVAIWGDVPGADRIRRERPLPARRCTKWTNDRGGAGHQRAGRDLDEAKEGDVWLINAPGMGFMHEQRLHPNEKPREVMERLVLLCSEPDDLVIDPTCGSGTTGVAALRLGRRFIGIELDPAWAELARERIAADERGSTLQAARAGQEALFR